MKEGTFYRYEPSCFTPKTWGFIGQCSSGDERKAMWMKFYWTISGKRFRAYCEQCKQRLSK